MREVLEFIIDYIAGAFRFISIVLVACLVIGLCVFLIALICSLIKIESDIGVFLICVIIAVPLFIWSWTRNI